MLVLLESSCQQKYSCEIWKHFTCIVTSQVFLKIQMQWSIALRNREQHLWIVFSFKVSDKFKVKKNRNGMSPIFDLGPQKYLKGVKPMVVDDVYNPCIHAWMVYVYFAKKY